MPRTAKRAKPASGSTRRQPTPPAPSRRAPKPARPSIGPEVKSAVAPTPVREDPLVVFQRGMASLQRHEYDEASGHFQAVLDQFPEEDSLLDRCRVYLTLCAREQKKRPKAPESLEERLTAATAALNNGDHVTAEALAKKILDLRPDHDTALYLLASLEARRGARDAALMWLARAIRVTPEIRAQARRDADFASLRDSDTFRRLLDRPAPAASPLGGASRRS